MRFADEVLATKDIDTATQKSHQPAKKLLDAAVAVIEELGPDLMAALERTPEQLQKGESARWS